MLHGFLVYTICVVWCVLLGARTDRELIGHPDVMRDFTSSGILDFGF